MKLPTVATIVCLAPTAQAFLPAPNAAAVGMRPLMRSAKTTTTTPTMVVPTASHAAMAAVLQSSATTLIAAGGLSEPGTVDAPGWVLPAGAGAVILLAGLIPLLLKV